MRRLEWVSRPPLRRQCEADALDAARRKGAPTPPSATKIAVRRHTESDVLRLPPKPRRRIVVIRPVAED